MRAKEKCKRYILFIVSLWFSALGVAFAKCGDLGVSPLSSVPNVLSIRFTVLTMGEWLILWSVLLILGQIALLKKDFPLEHLLQVPLAFVFGWFTDAGMAIARLVPVESYVMQLCMVVIGFVLLGFGVALAVIANVIMNAGDGFVRVLARKLDKNYGNVKIVFDIVNVLLSVGLSAVLFGGAILGVREGTLLAALCTGLVVKFFTKRLQKPLDQMLSA
ncbi:MAG: YitT family protein [Clostridia bacterium]|nr:YitT family protein [Clostridia bacterium]